MTNVAVVYFGGLNPRNSGAISDVDRVNTQTQALAYSVPHFDF